MIVLILLFSLQSAATYLNPDFDRPWESEILPDPGPAVSILGSEEEEITISYLYSIDQETIQSLKDETNEVKGAHNAHAELQDIRTEMAEKIGDILDIADVVVVADLATMLMNQWEITFVITTAGIIEVTSEGMDVIELSQEYYSTLMDSLEESERAYNGALSKTMTEYDELEQMGVSSDTYSGAQANNIAVLKAELESIDYEGLSTREDRIKSAASFIKVGSSISVYNNLISLSKEQIKNLIDGDTCVLSRIFTAYKHAKQIKKGILEENSALHSAVKSQTNTVSSEYNFVFSNYYGITDSDVFFFGISSLETFSSPREYINNGKKFMDNAAATANSGEYTFSAHQKSYVTESTSKYFEAIKTLDAASFEFGEAKRTGDFILSSAENITAKEYETASSEVANFIPHTDTEAKALAAAKDKIKEAGAYMKKGETAQEKIANLKIAFTALKTARTYISADNIFYENAADAARNNLNYLKSVIDRAKTDSVDVSYEEDYYNRKTIELDSGNVPVEEMINISTTANQLADMVFGKASAQYSPLWLRYDNLLSAVDYLEEIGGGALPQHVKISQYVSDAQFDPYKSLGHYTEISSHLSALELEVKIKSHDIIKQSLAQNTHSSISYGNSTVFLDQPATTIVQISTYTTLDRLNYTGPITVAVPLKQDITQFSVSKNPYGLEYNYNNGQLTIMINEYRPNTLYSLEFQSNRPLASTLSTQESSKMVSTKKLVLTVERGIVSYTLPQLGITPPYNYTYSLYLDGGYRGDFLGDTVIKGPISEGRHKLKYVFSIDNPIVTTVTDTKSTDTTTTITFKAANNADFNIENAPVRLDLPITSTESLSVVSSDCSVEKANSVNMPASTTVSFIIPVLPKASSCTFTVSAHTLFNRSSLEEEIERLENESGASGDINIGSHINAARSHLEAGEYDNAFKEINKAREVLESKTSDQAKSDAIKHEVARLDSVVKTAIDDLSSVKDERVGKALVKIKSYYDEASVEQSQDRKFSLLSKAAAEVSNLNSLAYSISSDYTSALNSIKQRWLSLIDKGYANTLPPEVSEVESMINNATSATEANSTTFQLLDSIEHTLSGLEENTTVAEKDEKEWESSIKTRFKSALSILKASNTQLLKSCSSHCPSDLVSSAQTLLQLSPTTPREYEDALNAVNTTTASINSYLQAQRTSANMAIGELRDTISKIANQEERDIFTKKLYDVESLYEKGSYEKAKDSAMALLNAMYSSPKSTNDYTLVLAGLALIIISFILIKMKGGNKKEAQEEIQKQLKRVQ